MDYRRVRKRRRRALPRSEHDWYVDPPWATELLLARERFGGVILDPACGGGTILDVCAARGLVTMGSDIADRGRGIRVDFLDERYPVPAVVDHIISNPPYRVAERFLERALVVARRKVAFLLRLAFLESEIRHSLFKRTPLARVYVFSGRVSMPPGGSGMEAEGGKTPYAWFVWDHRRPARKRPEIHWLLRPPASARSAPASSAVKHGD